MKFVFAALVTLALCSTGCSNLFFATAPAATQGKYYTVGSHHGMKVDGQVWLCSTDGKDAPCDLVTIEVEE
ncbi:MAG: hypothetical protein JXR76_12245 [Deltaproteobacteria bacterium]|nr:hypothetical protein [Deltaproteobacteria bacterium]